MNNIFKSILIFGVILLLSGCGINERWKTESRVLKKELINAEKKVLNQIQKYKEFKNSSQYKDVEKYAKRENWEKHFEDTSKLLKSSKELHIQIFKIVENDDEDEQEKLKKLNKILKTNIDKINTLSPYILKRIKLIKETKKTIDSLQQQALIGFEKTNQLYENTQEVFKKAKVDYPKKISNINEKEKKFNEMFLISEKNISLLKKEYNKTSSKRDYALYADTYESLSRNNQLIKVAHLSSNKKISELYQSYTRILTDIKIDNFVQVTRSTWNEYAEYGRDSIYKYPASKVSSKVYDYFYTLEIDNIAGYNSNFLANNRFTPNIDFNMWNALKISSSISNYHNRGVWWVSKFGQKFYHKYTIIKNNEEIKTDWIEVDNLTFDKNKANLGMEILSKPYGYYEDEKISTAAPAGMSAVGNSKYGEWRERRNTSTGMSGLYWFFLPRYSYYNSYGSSYYYQNDYRRYQDSRRRNQSYYGSNYQYGTWGSNTYSNNRYSSSHYAQSNAADVRASRNGKGSQQYKRSTSSIRGTGSSSRGRGPGGGGK
ncbi:MAG: hypothetical protein HRT43_14400 [Campylobacteraceae bacterium]|nr:hypothetical protein [Campylobacteraceae bacterium]